MRPAKTAAREGGEDAPVSATPAAFATRKYADAVMHRADFDAKDGSIFTVVPGHEPTGPAFGRPDDRLRE
jgi:hypothetical protein